jgi:hypothetical protein
VSTKLVYIVRLGREQLMFAADSCVSDERIYDYVQDATGDVGTLFIGMECEGAPLSWLYGPLLLRPIAREADRQRRLAGSDCSQVKSQIERFRVHDVYVYAMGQEPWLNHIMSVRYTDQSKPFVESDRVLRYCESQGIVAERLFGEKEILIDQL